MFYTKQHALSFGIVSIVSNLLLFVSYHVSYLFVILSSHFPSSSTTCLNLALLPWGAESLLFASVYIYTRRCLQRNDGAGEKLYSVQNKCIIAVLAGVG